MAPVIISIPWLAPVTPNQRLSAPMWTSSGWRPEAEAAIPAEVTPQWPGNTVMSSANSAAVRSRTAPRLPAAARSG